MDNRIRHIAFIMDGNRRYAKNAGLSLKEGVEKGLETLQLMVQELKKHKIPYVTVYAFSTENWKRSKFEVDILMSLLKKYLEKTLKELDNQSICIRFLGNIDGLPPSLSDLCYKVMDKSAKYDTQYLSIALNYGAKDEILRAVHAMVKNNVPVVEKNFITYLDTYPYPDPDILVRTGGDKRISNFLLWQLSYTELFFLNKMWPEMDKESLSKIMEDYYRRERRYGQ